MKFVLLRGRVMWTKEELRVGGIFWVNKKVKCRIYRLTERKAYIGTTDDGTQIIDVKKDCLFSPKFYVGYPCTHFFVINTKSNEFEIVEIAR